MFCFKTFYINHKSDIVLVNKCLKKFSFIEIKHKFLLESTICEVRQIYLKKELKLFFKNFNSKIKKAPPKIQKKFTYKKLKNTTILLEHVLSKSSRTGYLNYNLYLFLCNPCFLLNVVLF
jgi:hypothetical protein